MVIYRLHAIRNRTHTTESIRENQMFLKQIVVLKRHLDATVNVSLFPQFVQISFSKAFLSPLEP